MSRIIELVKKGVGVNLLPMADGGALVGCSVQQGPMSTSANRIVEAKDLAELDLEAVLTELAGRMGVES